LITAIHNELKNEISRRNIQKKIQSQRDNDEKLYDSNMGKSEITGLRQKSEELKMRNGNYRQQIEKMFEERQSKIVERQKIFEEKEEERKLIIENKIKLQQMKTKKKKEEKKVKIEMTMRNLEEKMKKRVDELEFKQLKHESKRIEFEETRQRKFNSRKEKAVKKNELILQVLEKNKEMEKRKIKEYYDKQAIISLRKEELEEIQNEEKRVKEQKSLERQRKIEDVKSY
jgi:colicin import membrane protein